MKEIKAYLHRNRVADVVHALKTAGFTNLCLTNVMGMLRALDRQEQDYSVELGEAVIHEIRLEMMCEDARVDEAIGLIREQGRTGQEDAGWIYVIDVRRAIRIEADGTG